jgi:hypothetical protein
MCVLAYAFFLGSRPLNDADFWWYLKTGEYVVRNGFVPHTDPFSFSNFGIAWVAHGWLSGTIFYAIYSSLGTNFLILLFALLAALAFWIVFKRCHSHPVIAGIAALLAAWTVQPTVGVRPRVFTLLLASAYLAILEGFARGKLSRSIWLLVPLMMFWANLHGAFLIGLFLIGLTLAGMVLDHWVVRDSGNSPGQIRTLIFVSLACFLATLINPYGVKIYSPAIKVMSSSIYNRVVSDWLSPNFQQPELFPLGLLILLTVMVLLLSPKTIKPSQLLMFLATLYATLKSQRNMAILALVAAPLLAFHFQSFLAVVASRTLSYPLLTASRRNALFVALVVLTPLAALTPRLISTVYGEPTQEMIKVPVKAVEFLRQNQIAGKTFTDPNMWGGYLIWALPSNPVYIDGRDVYPERFVQQYVEIASGVADWRVPFERYKVQIVLIRSDSLLARELATDPKWERMYQDEMSQVFKRRDVNFY